MTILKNLRRGVLENDSPTMMRDNHGMLLDEKFRMKPKYAQFQLHLIVPIHWSMSVKFHLIKFLWISLLGSKSWIGVSELYLWRVM